MAEAPYPMQQRHVVHLAGVAGLHHQADAGAGLLAHEVLVDRRRRAAATGSGPARALELRSERTMTFEPRAMAMLTCRRTSSMATAKRLAAAGDVEEPVDGEGVESPASRRARSRRASLASSSLSITGYGRMIWRHEPAGGSSRFASGPSLERPEVTSSSRMASSGGLVTWAKSWVK